MSPARSKSVFGASVRSARSFRCRSTIIVTMAGAWTIRASRRSTFIAADPDVAVPSLVAALGTRRSQADGRTHKGFPKLSNNKLTVDHLAYALRDAVGERPTSR